SPVAASYRATAGLAGKALDF
nr:RecName: Full=C-reactive protein [Mustelus canis]